MNRFVTNAIRFVMDDCMPPVLRDNKYFMYPFYYIWFKGKNIKQIMSFKSDVYKMSEQQFAQFYEDRDSLAKDRPTDLSQRCIDYMLERIDPDAKTLLDVGCGNGYFLKFASTKNLETFGCDILTGEDFEHSKYIQGDIEKLPFEDGAFDVVTCHHTLEHVINLRRSIDELKRVARKQVIVVVPCQRYFYYTLDEHVRFFPYKELLEHEMQMTNYHCEKVWGDLVFIGKV